MKFEKLRERDNRIISFSASDLVKKSAAQIKYLREKSPIKSSLSNQLKGVRFQSIIAQALNNDGKYCEEMRGTFSKGNIIIFFCNDIVSSKEIIEVKYIDPARPAEDWFLKSSILQAALYKSLLMNSNGELHTPLFRIKEGFKRMSKKVDLNTPYFLLFGSDKYSIECNDTKIIDFYIAKAIATIGSWDDAKRFDAKNKHKEFKILEKYINFEKV